MQTAAADTAPLAPTFAPQVVTPDPARREPVYGKDAAADYPHFRAYYSIRTAERGTFVTGPTPDGRYTGTCDRCGMAITHVYVFRHRTADHHMHVGIDCAQRMGVPLDALRAARGYAAEVGRLRATSERNAIRAAAAREARDREAAERAHNREVHGALIADLEALGADDNLTDWERRRLAQAVGMVERCGDCLTLAVATREDGTPYDTRSDVERDVALDVDTIRARLSLCRTSRVSSAAEILAATRALGGWSALPTARAALAATVKGKAGKGFSQAEKDAARGVLTVTLEAWRAPMQLEGGYYGGRATLRFRSFLRDDAGNAYTYVGSKPVGYGARVTATWTVDGTDTYAGLTATRLSRPRCGTIRELYGVGDVLPEAHAVPGDDAPAAIDDGTDDSHRYLRAPALGPEVAW